MSNLSELGDIFAGEPAEPKQDGNPVDVQPDGSQEVDVTLKAEDAGIEAGQHEDDGDVIEYLNAFAEDAGVDPDALYGLKISLGDELGDITIEQTKDRIQEQAREIATLKEQTGKFESELQQAQQQRPEQSPSIDNAMMQAQVRMENLQREYQSIDWNGIAAENPGQAAYKKQEYNDAYTQAQGQYAQAQQAAQKAQQETINRSYRETVKAIPEWADAKVRTAELNNIFAVAEGYGFDRQDISSVRDPRTFIMLRELTKLKAEKGVAAVALKAVHKAPKVLRSGSVRGSTKSKKLEGLIQKASQSRSRRTKANAGAALLSDIGAI